jgi:hypothetical protein
MTKTIRHLLSRWVSLSQPMRFHLDSNRPLADAEPLPAGAVEAPPLSVSPMTVTLLNYAYLQVLDLLTTSAFLLAGVREANPLVLLAMRVAPNAIVGLIAVKSMALLLGLICWRTSRARLLKAATAFYAVLVAYNLVCLILGLAVR